jgi:hypothetical protein
MRKTISSTMLKYVLGYATFGAAARTYALALQKRPLLDSTLSLTSDLPFRT